jgi:putative ABC transport system permease protein
VPREQLTRINHKQRKISPEIYPFSRLCDEKSDYVAVIPDNSDSVASTVGPTGRTNHTSECDLFGLTDASSSTPQANLLRVSTTAGSPAEKAAAIHVIEQALESRGLIVQSGLSLQELKTAMGEHITVLISTLIAAALVMGTVAGLGLSAMLSMSVIERTREFGILRAIGATPADVFRLIVAEAAVMGIFGLLAAIPLSLAVSALLGQIVGLAAFQIPLPLVFSGQGVAICVVALGLVIVAAAGLPARAAARLSVRTALDHR